MAALSYAPLLRVNGIAPGITLPAPGQTEDEFKKSHNVGDYSLTFSRIIQHVSRPKQKSE